MDKSASEKCELITFQMSQGEFCVDIMAVREIRGWTKATPLPYAPSYVCGVINLRGAVLSVIDLAARFGFTATEPTARHVIIVVQIGDQVTGLLVEAVTGILAVGPETILATPDIASEVAPSFIDGVLAIEDRMINLIGLGHIMPQALQTAA